MAALDLKIGMKIKASQQDVFNLLTDINRIPELFEGFKEVRNYHGGAVKIGDTWTVVTDFMGREILNDYTVTRLKEPTSLAWNSISPHAEVSSAFEIETHDAGSRIVLTVAGNPRGLVASVGMSLVEENLKEGIVRDLKNIRSILEGA